MTFDVILVKQADDGYTARPVLWPDAAAHGSTEQEALDSVRALIRDLLKQTQLVKVEIDTSTDQVNNPWLIKAGMFANDPTWDNFLKIMSDYRQQLDDEQVVESA